MKRMVDFKALVAKVKLGVKTVRAMAKLIIAVAVVVMALAAIKYIRMISDLEDANSQRNKVKSDFELVSKANKDYQQNYIPLDSARSIAKSLTTKHAKEMAAVKENAELYMTLGQLSGDERDKMLAKIRQFEDSLAQLGYKPSDVAFGSGKSTVLGSIKVDLNAVQNGKNEAGDDWLSLQLSVDKPKNWLGIEYGFNFEVFDAEITYSDEAQNKITMYSVGLRSVFNPKTVMYVQGYKREEVHLKPGIAVIRWFDPKIHLDLFPMIGGEALHGGLAVSIVTVAIGDKSKDVLLMLPSLGFVTNFKNSGMFDAAVRLNAAHYLPLFSDLHVVLGYGYRIWGTQGGLILIGIGTTL